MNEPARIPGPSSSPTPTAEELGFDVDELRKKYNFECDRRLRKDGEAQYETTDEDLYHYNDDRYVTQRIEWGRINRE